MRRLMIICGLFLILGNSSCNLDYVNTGAITPDICFFNRYLW